MSMVLRIALAAIGLTAAATLWSRPAWSGDKSVGKVITTVGTVLIRSENSQGGAVAGRGAREVKVGDEVFEGDVINTSSSSKIKLLMADKTILDLGNSTLFKVKEFQQKGGSLERNVDLQVSFGNIRAAVNQPVTGGGKFKVRTPTATMGVRGTEFIVKSDMPASMSDVKAGLSGQAPKPVAPAAPAAGGGGGTQAKAPEVKTEITVIQGKVEVAQPAAKPEAGRSAAAAPKAVTLTAGTQLTASASTAAAPAKPVQLSQSQMSSLVATSKVEDNTFKKAIVMDVGGGSGGGGGLGEMTRAALGESLSAAISSGMPQMTAGAGGFAGTFSVQQVVSNAGAPANLVPGGFKTLKVLITR